MTAGMFPINQIPSFVLFDSGSSHSFISEAFASKHQFPIDIVRNGYRINSVGAETSTNRVVHNVQLDIRGRRFLAHLIVLPNLGLDVILGMNWMKEYGVDGY